MLYFLEGFKMMEKSEAMPEGWRVASIDDVTKYQQKAHSAINLQWAICTLDDGKIAGSGYNYETERGYFPDLGHKLTINSVLDITGKREKTMCCSSKKVSPLVCTYSSNTSFMIFRSYESW